MGKLYRKYQILETDVDLLWDFQGGICPICCQLLDKSGLGMDIPCIDHDHQTGAVRGIIHSRCNLMLGYAGDNGDVLRNAVDYLTNNPASTLFAQEEDI